jgi:protein TonB
MNADRMGQTADLSTTGSARLVAGATNRERNFYIALACAALLHASFFIGAALKGTPKELGDPSGAEDAISVSLVTEADLKSRSTVAEPPSPPPLPETAPTPPPQPEAAKPPQPEAQQPPPPTPQPEPQEQPQPDVAKPEEPQVAKQEDPKTEANAPDLFSLQDQNPANLKSDTEPKPKPKPEAKPESSKSTANKSASKPAPKTQKKRLSELDLSTPKDMTPSFSGGHAAAFQRPPGITRSGLNDAFARAVIRALQQTMPQLNGALGRVTVRILLSESGNVVEVRLLAGARDTALNQDVVFAAQQTSYPIPPAGSNLADRTFMVTYIYD